MGLEDFNDVFLPYCLDRQTDGRYAVLNREYKPVGFYTGAHVVYKEYPVLVKFKGLTKTKLDKLSWDGKGGLKRIYLYDTGRNHPLRSKAHMRAYLEKLEILAKLPIVRAI